MKRPEQLSRKLQAFQTATNIRDDWHEPDNQQVTAVVTGNHLDNAMGDTGRCGEFVVRLSVDGVEICVVNLATLLAAAAQCSRP